MPQVITIDGPAGSGKSTTARAVSAQLGFAYLDSGAIYRAVALGVQRARRDSAGEDEIGALAAALRLRVIPGRGHCHIFIGDEDVTGLLRDQALGQLASRVAQMPAVRTVVRGWLQAAASAAPCVAEGRDMGTVVFPDAALKIYLDPPLAIRAQRRFRELIMRGATPDESAVRAEIEERDLRDRNRSASPLRVPADAIVIDNSHLDIRGQAALVTDLYRGGGRRRGRRFYRVARAIVRAFGNALLGVQALGVENVPRGASLIACNHRSNLDPPLLGSYAPGAIGFLAKEELFRSFILRALISRLYALPVRRGRFDRAAIRLVLARLGEALPVLVFPEGTRQRDGQPGAARGGIALLARMSGAPVVPAHISGSDRLGALLLRKRRITITFGPPLVVDSAGGELDEQFVSRVMAAIQSLEPNPQ